MASKYYRIKKMSNEELERYIKESDEVIKSQGDIMLDVTRKRIERDTRLFKNELKKRKAGVRKR